MEVNSNNNNNLNNNNNINNNNYSFNRENDKKESLGLSQNNFYQSQKVNNKFDNKYDNNTGSRFDNNTGSRFDSNTNTNLHNTNQGLGSSFSNFYNNYNKKSLQSDLKQ